MADLTLAAQIERLKQERDAVILAHYYVPQETQELADYVGDSFYLARLARTLDCSTIVLCGVSFMAESVKMLNPKRTVLLPDPKADCPMAHMVSKQTVDTARAAYDDLAVVCYINSTAEVKAWSDVCVTSANAVAVVRALPQHNILFIPDMHLGHYVSLQVPEKHFILNQGWCPIHHAMDAANIALLKEQHPDAIVLAHPECTQELLAKADFIGSTKQMIDYVAQSDAREFIIGTVEGVRVEMERVTQGQGKIFWFTTPAPVCADMMLVTPEKVLVCLRDGTGEVPMPADAVPATAPLDRMLDLAVAR